MRCENSTLLCLKWPLAPRFHMFLPITFVIFSQFSIRKKFWKVEAKGFSTIPSILYMSILSIQDKDL